MFHMYTSIMYGIVSILIHAYETYKLNDIFAKHYRI